MIGRVALLVTFKKAKPKPQSLSRSHIRDVIGNVSVVPTMAGVASMLYTRFDTSHLVCSSGVDRCARG